MCERGAVARGLCSAHYQQWRYRERKTRLARRVERLEREEQIEVPVPPAAPIIPARTTGKLN